MATQESYQEIAGDRVHADFRSMLIRRIPIGAASTQNLMEKLQPDVQMVHDKLGYDELNETGAESTLNGLTLTQSILYKAIFNFPYSRAVVDTNYYVADGSRTLLQGSILLRNDPNTECAKITVTTLPGTEHAVYELAQATSARKLDRAPIELLTDYEVEGILAELLVQTEIPRQELIKLGGVEAMMCALVARSAKPVTTRTSTNGWFNQAEGDKTLIIKQVAHKIGKSLLQATDISLSTSSELAKDRGQLLTGLALHAEKLDKPSSNVKTGGPSATLTVDIQDTSFDRFPQSDRDGLFKAHVLRTSTQLKVKKTIQDAVDQLLEAQ